MAINWNGNLIKAEHGEPGDVNIAGTGKQRTPHKARINGSHPQFPAHSRQVAKAANTATNYTQLRTQLSSLPCRGADRADLATPTVASGCFDWRKPTLQEIASLDLLRMLNFLMPNWNTIIFNAYRL